MSVPVIYHLDDLEEMAKTIAKEQNEGKQEGEETVAAEELTQTEVLQYLLQRNPELKGCFATNVNASQELLGAMEELELQIPVIAVDGGKEQLKALEEERLDGLLVQNPYGMGYSVVVSAARAALGMGNEAFIDTGYIWVTKSNLKKQSIQKMLY